jgi:diguanylate cyclase (GGDEF)-like protein/PAS domain S-box-containing protein
VQPIATSKSRLACWLTEPGQAVDPAISSHLTSGLYTSIPIFLGGVANSIAVAAIAAARHPTALFLVWLATEVMLGFARLFAVIIARRATRHDRPPPIGFLALLACGWAASVGFGAFISLDSQDWILATIGCLSATGMVSGICLRNFGTPRLATVMMLLTLVPCALGALFTHQPALLIITVQLPFYTAAIGSAAFRLNRMTLARMVAQDALERSEAFNRSILESSPDYTLLLDQAGKVIFCNSPGPESSSESTIIDSRWLDMLPAEAKAEGRKALGTAQQGKTARLIVAHDGPAGRRWFDLALSRVAGSARQTLIVARDITYQKSSEEKAVWMANHDALTGLPNRIVLQDRLDAATSAAGQPGFALLVLDIDNFKLINDTLGHDAGDALLCVFADRLRSAIRPDDLVARLAGDEFAIMLRSTSDAQVRRAVRKIYDTLHRPFVHDGRVIECDASIGACLFPRDGREGSELLKAADMALYSAKSSAKGQMKVFVSGLRNDFQARNSMLFLARRALAAGHVFPYYQPKVALRTGRIVGFEALMRWRDPAGLLRLPEKLKAAFDDPTLAKSISDRIIERTLADIRGWLDQGVEFGHVAINVAAAEFRSGKFAEQLLDKLGAAEIPARLLQIEVTETVFLGRGADHVHRALRQLSRAGLRIALDDFGTGYASLAHLMQFPVDAIKIDQSFIKSMGASGEAEAIARAIVTLGQSLGIETIAEGIERADQEASLLRLGCQTGQGFLYSRAVPADMVSQMLLREAKRSA